MQVQASNWTKQKSKINHTRTYRKYSDVIDKAYKISNKSDVYNCNYDDDNMFCSKYCSNDRMISAGFYMNSINEFKEIEGLNVKKVNEIYDSDADDFIKFYPCNVNKFSCEDTDN